MIGGIEDVNGRKLNVGILWREAVRPVWRKCKTLGRELSGSTCSPDSQNWVLSRVSVEGKGGKARYIPRWVGMCRRERVLEGRSLGQIRGLNLQVSSISSISEWKHLKLAVDSGLFEGTYDRSQEFFLAD